MNNSIQIIIIFLLTVFRFHHLEAQVQSSAALNHEPTSWQEQAEANVLSYGLDTLKSTPVSGTVAGNQWWKVLGYESLNELVALALNENYQLATVHSQVKESEARVQLAKSSLYPTIGFNPSFYRQEFSGNRPLPFDLPADRITYNTYSLPIDLSYEIDIFGRNKSNVKASQFNLQAASASEQAYQLDVASAVTRNFIFLLTLDSEAKIMESTRQAREENLEIVTIRYEAGLTNEIDVQRAKSELSSVEVQIKNIQIDRREVELQLASLTGQTASDFSVESEGIQYFAPALSAVDNIALIENRPDLQASKYAVEASKMQIKAARKNRYPALYVSGSAGLLAGNSNQIFDGESRNWLLGAGLSVPLFEGGKRQALLHISEHQLEGAEGMFKHNELVAGREVANELSDLQRLEEQLTAQQGFLAAARRAADLSRQRYKKGLVTYLEVVDADRIVLEAERLSIQLLGQQLLSTVDLIVASGGTLEKLDIK